MASQESKDKKQFKLGLNTISNLTWFVQGKEKETF